MNTTDSRTKIGFPDQRTDWSKNPAIYDEHTLRIAGHPVMEDWEQSYMERLAEIASMNGGKVLEVGYGMGLSARAIQEEGIDAHYIIECHPDVVQRCASDMHADIGANRAHLLSGYWEDITPLIADNTFNGILFDTYPLTEEEIHSNHFWFFKEAYRILAPGGVLTYYSDEVDTFSEKHRAKLIEAGFSPEKMTSEICPVEPPADCEYWQANTILAPIIRK